MLSEVKAKRLASWRILAARTLPVAVSLTISGKRVRACETEYEGSGRSFCNGHRYGNSQWSARVRDTLHSTC